MVLSLSSISFKPGSSNFVFFYWSALVYDFVDVSSPGKYLPHSWPRFVPHTWIGSTYVTRVCRPESTRAQKKPDACYAPELPLHGESSAPVLMKLRRWLAGTGFCSSDWECFSLAWCGLVCLGFQRLLTFCRWWTLLWCRYGFILRVHFQGLPWFQFFVTSVENEDQVLEN